jgi:glyceraldehyde-3-phosphate dehydrogenase/erythrose-4-phosphate dehydrogenase
MKEASDGYLKGILAYADKDVVSSDIRGETFTSVFDSSQLRRQYWPHWVP